MVKPKLPKTRAVKNIALEPREIFFMDIFPIYDPIKIIPKKIRRLFERINAGIEKIL